MSLNFKSTASALFSWDMRKSAVLLGILFLAQACIDPYAGDINFSGSKLVIEGLVTDAFAPYRVKISQSVAYNSTDGNVPVQDATVYVQDDKGNTFVFAHDNRGVYFSDPLQFRGEVGRTYTLFVKTKDGKVVQSAPETLSKAPEIDSAYTLPETSISIQGVESTQFGGFLRFRDAASTGEFYRINFARYEAEEYCKTKIVGEFAVAFKNPCCTSCWKITPCRGCVLLLSDNLLNGNSVDYRFSAIPYDSQDDYFVLLELSRISRTTYQFWKTASTQVNNTGGIFDAPPAALPGNLFNTKDDREQVLGIFSAAGVSRKGVYLKRNYLSFNPTNTKVPFPTQVVPECVECLESLNRTRFAPPGW